jgi:putative flippase GtrA
LIWKYKTVRYFVKYSLAGVVSAAVDIGTYTLLTLGNEEHPLTANLVSRSLGGLVCFYLNKYWTFGNKGRSHDLIQFGRFWIIFGVSLGLSEALLWLIYDVIGMTAVPSKLLVEGILVLFNFAALRHWAFG